jgi:predicted dehydrogenase
MTTRLIMVGFGRAGEAHSRYYRTRPDVDVVGVVDPVPARRSLAQSLFPAAAVVSDFADLGARADLAVITTPPADHANDIRHALHFGAHVLCEKPAVLDPLAGQELAAIAARTGRVLYPSHNYLTAPFTRQLDKVITTGSIGTPQYLEIEIERPTPATGVTEWQPSWRTQQTIAGGGVLVDHGTHCIYLAEALMRSSIEAVSCSTTPLDGSSGVDNEATLQMRFTGGEQGIVHLSWTGSRRRNRYLIQGSRGTLSAEGPRVVLTTEALRRTWAVADPAAVNHAHADWLPGLFADVKRRIVDPASEEPLPWASAITVARVLTAAYASADRAGAWLGV